MDQKVSLFLTLLFLGSIFSSDAQKNENQRTIKVKSGQPLVVECELRAEQRLEWLKDGEAIAADMRLEPESPANEGRLVARLKSQAARAHHAGLYTCTRDKPNLPVKVVVAATTTASDASVTVSGEPYTLPPAAAVAPVSAAAGAISGADGELPVVYYEVSRNLSLTCTLPREKNDIYVWKKNGTELEKHTELNNRYTLSNDNSIFSIKSNIKSTEDDFGNYTCSAGSHVQGWEVRGKKYAKLPANSNVVEGQKLKLQCKLIGKPYPEYVTWRYSNATDKEDNTTWDVIDVLGVDRVKLQKNEQGVDNAELVVEVAQRSDAGKYICSADETVPSETVLRVKDMYAALWPFLGICAEVFVLCAIILVYEKRRTKPELDDSDTDNHDQKKS